MAVHEVSVRRGDAFRTSTPILVNIQTEYDESSGAFAFDMPARSMVMRVVVAPEVAWNAPTSVLSIGSTTNNSLLVSGAVLATTTPQAFNTPVYFDTQTEINLYPTNGTSTTGLAWVAVEICTIPRY